MKILPRKIPRGFSLLEVLISMFVLMVGLLGVAALLPVGHYNLVEATKADRGGACGRAAMRLAKVSGMLNPEMWIASDGNAWHVLPLGFVNSNTQSQGLNFGSAVVIDPLYLAANSYPLTAQSGYFGYTSSPNLPHIYRLSLLRQPIQLAQVTTLLQSVNPSLLLLPLPAAQRIFVSDDDLSFENSTIGERTRARVFQIPTTAQSQGMLSQIAYPILPSDGRQQITANVNVLQAISAGAFSWMITLSPVTSEQSLSLSESQRYTLSIVVFYRRNLTAIDPTDAKPSERPVVLDQTGQYGLNSTGFGWGGGDIVLQGDANHISSTNPDDYLEAKPGEWLLIAAQRADTSVVCEWYRVVNSVPDIDPTTGQPSMGQNARRYVTLAGPDWTDLGDSPAGNGMPQIYGNPLAVLVSGVVGVYQTVVTLDRHIPWIPAGNL